MENIEKLREEIEAKENELNILKNNLRLIGYKEQAKMAKFLEQNRDYPIKFQIDWGDYITKYILQPNSWGITDVKKHLFFQMTCDHFNAPLDMIENLQVLYDQNVNEGKDFYQEFQKI